MIESILGREAFMQGKKSIFVVVVSIIFIMICSSVYADIVPATMRPSVRALAMGGSFITNTDDLDAMLYNPAILSNFRGFNLSLVNMTVRMSSDVLKVGKFVQDHKDDFLKFKDNQLTPEQSKDLYKDMNPFDNRWNQIAIDPMVGLAFQNFGIAIYGAVDPISVKADKGIYEPRVSGQGTMDAVGVVGYGKKILDGRLGVGASGKFFQRRQTGQIRVKASDLGGVSDLANEVLDKLKNEKNSGYGIDLGALMFLDKYGKTQVAASWKDAFGKIGGDRPPSDLKIGISHRLLIPLLTVSGQIDDAFNDQGENLFKRTHIGAELDLPILNLRAGFNSGYPTFGFGISFKILRIDYAFYGEELGPYPGQNQQNYHAIGINIGWQ